MFRRLLIANRGEIACRIARTARRMGLVTIAVYSDADARARHVAACDEAVRIGPPPARESYLRIDAILEAARATGAEAIHPGYGFLSEDEDFAAACEAAGIVFVGPPASAIRAMGSKSAAKALMARAGVPLTPGYHGEEQDPAGLESEARAIGFPVLIKASAGGGGKGMRRVDRAEDFGAALQSCRREAAASFGDDRVLVEKYVLDPRHIEVQVFADTHGGCIHLFERDCSVQRRHQKVIEEAPAPGMSDARREAMTAAAIAAARAVGYVGAGTVEFIVDPAGAFYFMEMNTRLQVEHPVTEMVTGLDLVEWQLRVAAGERLPLRQDEVRLRGHAIEARIYAEDPAAGFLPSTGRLAYLVFPPESPQVRVDTGVGPGDEITPWYDPMIAKLIAWGETREAARRRLRAALEELRIAGVANNVAFLARLLETESFSRAQLDTGLIGRESAQVLPQDSSVPEAAWLIAAVARFAGRVASARDTRGIATVWDAIGPWRLNATVGQRLVLRHASTERAITASSSSEGWRIEIDGTGHRVALIEERAPKLRVEIDGRQLEATVIREPDALTVLLGVEAYRFEVVDARKGRAAEALDPGHLRAPMPGKVVAVLAKEGTRVERGAALLVLEAMKMEHTITAPVTGRLAALHVAVGDQVQEGFELAALEADGSAG